MARINHFLRRPSVAFVLSGGGNLGALQVGQLAALAERGIQADVVVGCSVGAMNGAAYAADPTPEGVRHLSQLWRRVVDHDLMASSWIPPAVQLMRRGTSIANNEALRSTVEALVDGRGRFEDLALPFHCVATDVDAGVEQWFSSGNLVDAILASAALPSVYPMVTIDTRRFIDGGVVNNVPLSRAIELGARKVYVLHVGPHGRPNPEVRRPFDAALIAYWIARNARFARDLASVPKGVEVVVIPPGRRPEIRYDDFSQTPALVEQGRSNAAAYLDELAELDARDDLPTRSERLADDVRRLVEDLRGRVGERWRERNDAEGPPPDASEPEGAEPVSADDASRAPGSSVESEA